MRWNFKQGWVVFGLIIFGLGSQLAFADDHDDDDSYLLHVSGQGKISVIANIAEVRMHVEVSHQAVQEIHSQLSSKSKKVLTALRKKNAQKLTTTQMQIYPQYDPKQRNRVIGYRGQMSILFRTSTDEAGPMIDAALQAGANRMDGFSFVAEDEKLQAAQKEAQAMAAKNALEQAKVILDAMKLEMDGIAEIRVGQAAVPYQAKQFRAMAAMEAAPSTEITAGEQQIYATVYVKIRFKAKDY